MNKHIVSKAALGSVMAVVASPATVVSPAQAVYLCGTNGPEVCFHEHWGWAGSAAVFE